MFHVRNYPWYLWIRSNTYTTNTKWEHTALQWGWSQRLGPKGEGVATALQASMGHIWVTRRLSVADRPLLFLSRLGRQPLRRTRWATDRSMASRLPWKGNKPVRMKNAGTLKANEPAVGRAVSQYRGHNTVIPIAPRQAWLIANVHAGRIIVFSIPPFSSTRGPSDASTPSSSEWDLVHLSVTRLVPIGDTTRFPTTVIFQDI